MNDENRQHLEAWFDGQVPAGRCAAIEELIARDPEARAYVDQLNRIREALHQAHAPRYVPSGAWPAMQRRLQGVRKREESRIVGFPQLVAAAAAVMIIGMLLWLPLRKAGHAAPEDYAPGIESSVQFVETDLENVTPIVYIDQVSGWTVVWIMENEGLPGAG